MSAQYELVIGTQNFSSWSLRSYLALRAVGAAFEIVKIRLRQPDTQEQTRRLSPSGKVPLLTIHEAGRVIRVWDSLAICETLAERHAAAMLWPQEAAARAHARAICAEMHAGFPDLRDQLGMDFVRHLPCPDLREATRMQIARIVAIWQEALDLYGGPFLFGGFSLADCIYAPVVSRFRTYGISVPPEVAAYMERIWQTPAMQDWGAAAQAEIEAGEA